MEKNKKEKELPLLKIITIVLFIILLAGRFTIRAKDNLWTDELEEIHNLTSVKHLLVEYLPFIPGGAPGHYLVSLPLQVLVPNNKFILGLPGLLGHIAVFLLMRHVVKSLKIVDEKGLPIVTLIARTGFVFDPTFIFQSMEIRPYSLLPLLWSLSLLLTSGFLLKQKVNKTVFWLSVISLVIIIIWHFYGFLMLTSLMLYYWVTQRELFRGGFVKIMLLPVSLMLSLPFLWYFSKGSFVYNFDSFEMLKISYLNWQTYFYLTVFILMVYFSYFKKILTEKFIKAFLTLILFPVIVILFLDLSNHYWFLLRQFAWTMLPVYIIIGSIIYNSKIIKTITAYEK